MKKLFNEIHVCFYKWIQLDLDLDSTNIKLMFDYLIKKDRKFIRYCPESIEDDIFIFEKYIDKLSEDEGKKLTNFVSCCIDVYNYDKIANKNQNMQLDLLYYRAVIAQYYILNTLTSVLETTKFMNFKKEFYQIGVIIGNFYTTKDQSEKSVTASMIKSKTNELFKRFNFEYSLPLCTL